jgi:hypothetical protein
VVAVVKQSRRVSGWGREAVRREGGLGGAESGRRTKRTEEAFEEVTVAEMAMQSGMPVGGAGKAGAGGTAGSRSRGVQVKPEVLRDHREARPVAKKPGKASVLGRGEGEPKEERTMGSREPEAPR